MKTNKPSPVKENNESPITRMTVTVGEPENSNEVFPMIMGILAILLLFGFAFQYHKHDKIDSSFASNLIVEDKPPAFVEKINLNFIFPTPTPKPKTVVVRKPASNIVITGKADNIQINTIQKRKVSPGYHLYDDIIIRETKKWKGVRPVVIKAIIEHESYYNPYAKRYEAKWQREYAALAPKQKNQNHEEWKLNFNSLGLMQVGYILHKEFCDLNDVKDLYDPEKNIACGTKLFGSCIEEGNSEAYCIKRYNGTGPATEIYKKEVMGRMARITLAIDKLMS